MAFYGRFSRGKLHDFPNTNEIGKVSGKKTYSYSDTNIHFLHTNKENFLEYNNGFVYIEGKIFSHNIKDMVSLYHKMGAGFFKHLSGEFFAILYDRRRGRLFLVSDKRGSRKCYYGLEHNGAVFSSQIKPLMISMERSTVDKNALIEFLVFGVPMSPHTFVQGIGQSKFAEIIELSLGNVSLNCGKTSYFDSSFFIHKFPKDFRVLARYIFDVYKTSVEERIRNFKSVDILSSGGIDSAVLVYLASLSKDRINTYTIGYEKESIDERRYARLLSNFFGTKHKEAILKSDLVKLSPMVVWHEEAPHQSVRSLLNFSLSKLTRSKDSVLSGEGIENQFLTGFDYGLVFHLNKMDFLTRFGNTLPIKLWCYMHYVPSFYNLLSKETIVNLKSSIFGSNILKKYSMFKFRIWDVEYVGTFQKTSEAFNSQLLFPFLDERCFKLYSLPDRLRKEKFLFSKAFSDKIPQEIVGRKKMKIVSPSNVWLEEQNDIMMEFVKRFGKRDIIPESMLTEYLNTRMPNHDRHFWSIFFLEIFLETFFDKNKLAGPIKNLSELL